MRTELIDDMEAAADEVGTASYFANFRHFRTLKITTAALGFLVLVTVGAITFLATRPPHLVVLRIDSDGRVDAMNLRETSYTPQDVEIRRDLNAWVIWRYRLTRETAREDFPKNYYFLSSTLTRRLRAADMETVAGVLAGSEPEQVVTVDRISVKPESRRNTPAGVVGTGASQIEIRIRKDLDSDPAGPQEHWLLDLTYEVNPAGAADRARTDPLFQIYNPLGITFTSFFETRIPEAGK